MSWEMWRLPERMETPSLLWLQLTLTVLLLLRNEKCVAGSFDVGAVASVPSPALSSRQVLIAALACSRDDTRHRGADAECSG